MPVFFDLGETKTYDIKGVKCVNVRTNVGRKMRTTVFLAVLSDGTKLPPLIIFNNRRITPVSNPFSLHSMAFQNSAGWITNEILQVWFDQVFFNMNFEASDYIPYLILDRCPAHQHSSILKILNDSKVLYSFIPTS